MLRLQGSERGRRDSLPGLHQRHLTHPMQPRRPRFRYLDW
jgi:hypothetical protein